MAGSRRGAVEREGVALLEDAVDDGLGEVLTVEDLSPRGRVVIQRREPCARRTLPSYCGGRARRTRYCLAVIDVRDHEVRRSDEPSISCVRAAA
jgi:hypothetical protein